MNWLFRNGRPLVYLSSAVWLVLLAGWAYYKIPVLPLALPEFSRNVGLSALYLLFATYIPGLVAAVAPRARLLATLVHARRAVGLSTLAYVLIHVTLAFFIAFDGSFTQIARLSFPYSASIALGTVALIGLIALGLTANDRAVRALGKRWKQLHRLTYLFTSAALLHTLYIGSDFVEQGRPLGVTTVIVALVLTISKILAIAAELRHRPVQPDALQATAEKVVLLGVVIAAAYISYGALFGTIGHQHP